MAKTNGPAILVPSAGSASIGVRGAARLQPWMWVLIAATAILMILLFLLVRYFPFSQTNVAESLRETFPSNITIDHFATSFFPHPGCKAQGVKFRSLSSRPDAPPVATIGTLIIQASYADLLFRPHHISKVILEGLRIQVPPLGDAGKFTGGYANSAMSIGEVVANGTLLDIARAGGNPPLRFHIHDLNLASVSANGGMNYSVRMSNPEPPGEIQSVGHFGPFHAASPGETPVSGKYSFDHADLSVFHGIAGMLFSEGTFSGPLKNVNVQGTTNVPDFEVVRTEHAGPLTTRFDAQVNGLNGDVALTSVKASYLNTAISAKGTVAGKEGVDGKFTSLDFVVHDGRIQDLLRLFVHGKRPPMDGTTSMQAHVTVPPEGEPFLEELALQGDFDIRDGHFEKPERQESVNRLSATARGDKKAAQEEAHDNPADNVFSYTQSHVDVHNGVASFADLEFTLPGADARMHGTYNLLNEKVDLHGSLKMDAKFSQSTSGIKALFAKVLDPFLDKKHGSVVPVVVDGSYRRPHFGIDLDPIK